MDLAEIDLADPDSFVAGTPHHWFKALRERDPLHWHAEPAGPGFWCVTKYDDLRHVSRNPQLFSSWLGGTNIHDVPAGVLPRLRVLMLNMDPPQHVKFRRIVQRGFTPRMVAAQEPHIRELARRIVDAVAPRGEAEFVEELAAELPLQVICELMGVPLEDRKLIFDLTNTMVGFDDPEFGGDEAKRMQASAGLFAYSMKLAERFKAEPADNLTTSLLRGEVDGENLSELEYASFFLLLCVAGNETTRTVTSNGYKLLLEHPEQLALLAREPARIPAAVEEILRFEPAVHYFRRTATQDVELRGKTLRAGQKVVIWYPSANRDEERFADPDRFDVTRADNEHLSFGIGEHFCLGANLARLELNVIFEELIGRLRNPRLLAPPRRLRSNFINGVKEMRIGFDAEPAR